MTSKELEKIIDNNFEFEKQQALQVLNQLDLKEKRLTDKTNVLSQLQYEKELIEKDIVNTIKTSLNTSSINIFRYFNSDLLSNIWRGWLNKDKEKDKQFKDNLDYILKIIKSKLLNNDDDFKLKDIYDFGYSSAYEFIFDYKSQEVLVYIPVFANITERNKPYIMYGYMIQYKQDEYTWITITRGFDTNKISQDLKEWLNNDK